MNFKAAALSIVLGVTAPASANLTVILPAVARDLYPSGTYQDNLWIVNFSLSEGDSFNYLARHKETGATVELHGANVRIGDAGNLYTWYDGQIRYQVHWRPGEANVIGLRIYDAKDRQIFSSQLLRSGR